MVFTLEKNTAIYIGIGSTMVTWLILAPIALYYTYIFYRSRDQDYISKRQPKLVLIINFSLIIDAMITRPFTVYTDIEYEDMTLIATDNEQQFILNIKTFSTMSAWTLLFTSLLLNIRLFSTYYNWTKSKHLLSAKWKSQTIFNKEVNNNNNNNNNNNVIPWTMTRYGQIFGSTKLMICLSILWFIMAEISVMLTVHNAIYYNIIKVIFGFSSFVVTIILLCISLKLKDSLGIRAEIRMIAALFIIGSILWFTASIILSKYYFLHEIVCLFVVELFLILIAIKLSTPLSMNKIPCTSYSKVYIQDAIFSGITFVQSRSRSYSMDFRETESNPNNCGHTRGKKGLFSPRTTMSLLNKFTVLLEDHDGFEYFANALVKEFAVESLLFLLEFKQLQNDMINNEFIDAKNVWECNINTGILNKVCMDHVNIDSCFQYISRICQQYIYQHSIAQINISYHHRNQIIQLMTTNMTGDGEKIKYDIELLQSLYNKLEEAATEIFMLLFTDSFIRFSQTINYKNWLNLTKPENEIRDRARSKSKDININQMISI